MTSESPVTIFIGNVIHCTKRFSVSTLEKGFVAVQGQKIISVDNASALESIKAQLGIKNCKEIFLTDTQILVPGLIDTHIHAPQYPNAGLGYDKPLLDWLDTYTYRLEKKYKDPNFSKKIYNSVVRKTLDHGTTTACYFASLYDDTSIFLADAAINIGQRAFVGKVNMTKLAPVDYIETPEESIANTKKFIQAVISKKSHLVKPIITPRFPLSVDMDLMKKLAAIAKEHDLHIQSHISENTEELKMIDKLYKKSYAEVYNEANLLTPKTVLAHGVHLTDAEIKLLASKDTSISHCPESNTNLQSGMCDVKKLVQGGVTVGLGTDVSGGASPSIVNTMREAINTSIHLSFEKNNYDPLNCYDVFYLATLGGAKALALDEYIGNFVVGKDFDALIVDMDVKSSSADYLQQCTPLELLQKFIYLGDDRNIVEVYVSGRKVK